ncbi:hypothetical protein Q0M94_19295 (plasmid) [Deinococcus radiomollis]|uniref:hypothetical protein n=1 Tax=Deinococcus radiomollis TaxID=468916 RepID=UPI003891BE0A
MKLIMTLLELVARQTNKNTQELEEQGDEFSKDIDNLIEQLEDTRLVLADSQAAFKASLERLDWCEAELEKNRIARAEYELAEDVTAYEATIQNLK